MRVVAVDQSIAQGAVAAGDNATGRLARTVTLEVTPQQAERAVVAERLGKVTLLIRSAEAAASPDAELPSVYGGDISAALGDRAIAGAPRMRVIEGNEARDVTFQ